ncbi:hypothetical protein [Botrimarina mediterranea]|uniref:Uncharacterized protein n=1 Tax=Botrimarina mediterranea TaxID=2528022 RepID=A0A518K5Z5_9BACT|nr:hypothetical protein [Botrimarina mediterranea]QDV73197.1 hypothetical protein Spa11_13930 [Botrimarina mediterranea]
MAKKTQKPLLEQCKKVTIRFTDGQAEKIAVECLKSGIKPSAFLRLASVAFVDHKMLDLKSTQQTVLDELIRLRRDFSDALVRGDD